MYYMLSITLCMVSLSLFYDYDAAGEMQTSATFGIN